MEMELRPELKAFVDEQVRSGRYESTAEVLEAGLARLMLDPVPDVLDEQDLATIAESDAQFARGEGLDWAGVRAELVRKYLSR